MIKVKKDDNEFVNHYHALGFDILCDLLGVMGGIAMLIAPIALLYLVNMSKASKLVTAAFSVTMSSILVSLGTGAKLHEVFFFAAA